MRNPVEIAFGQFLPDAPGYRNPGCIRANNVIPIAGGYAPFRGAGTAGGTATEACLGAHLYGRSTGDDVIVGGGVDRLWVDVNGTVTETAMTSIGDAYWQFQRFGARILAVSQNNDLQQITDIDSVTSWTAVLDAPTRAEVIGEVGSRVIVGNLSNNPYGFEWSALNDPTTWTADATNYCGSGELDQSYGEITGIAGDRFSVIFQEYAASRIERVGPPSVFSVQRIEEARGCIAPNSIATVGYRSYFLAHDGFAVTNGAEVRLIGTNRVNRFFLGAVSEVDRYRTHAAIDWQNECVVWMYYPTGGTTFNRAVIYSWAQDRWATASIEVDWLVASVVAGTTLEELDATYPSLDDMTISLDSTQFQAGGRRLSAYVSSGGNSTVYAFDGDALEATFETAEAQIIPGRRSYIGAVYPLVENADSNTQAAIITKNTKGGTETVSAAGVENAAGFCPVRAEGRYARCQLIIPAGATWDKAIGVQVAGRPTGWR